TAVVLLKFENGATAIINNSRKSVYGYDQRLEVFGTMGMANLDNHYLDTHRFYNHEGGHSPLALDFFLERYEDAYLQEMNAFVEAVRLEQPIPVGVFDALQATRIALAAQRSMTENLPIKFSEIK
ncbi:MAG: Gfo/Idh/MocA family oxidoreductase, partial [Saprospiraceae bacterium]|nr:Gfo/Idh/MocA family oxidoreductase [Saprospiraceae bacterium]